MSTVSGLAPFDLVPRWLRTLGLHAYSTYAALSSFADENGGCYPGVETLAVRAMISKRAAQRALRDLEEAGAISVEKRRREGGSQATNFYRLRAHDRGAGESPQGRTTDTAGVSVSHPNENQVNEKTDSPAESPGRDSAEGCSPVVAEVCAEIAEHVAWTTERSAPKVTNEWRKAVRLMLTAEPKGDGWEVRQLRYVLGWFRSGTRDAIFWRKNILSAPTMRRQMPKLVAAIKGERDMAAVAPAGGSVLTPDFMDGYVEDGLDPFTSALMQARREAAEREGAEVPS